MGLFAQIKKGEKRMLQTTSAGLSEAEAKARLAKVGENRLRGKKGASVAAMFFSQFKDVMILILAAASLVLYSLVAWAIGRAAAVVRAWKAGRQKNAPNSRRRGHGA